MSVAAGRVFALARCGHAVTPTVFSLRLTDGADLRQTPVPISTGATELDCGRLRATTHLLAVLTCTPAPQLTAFGMQEPALRWQTATGPGFVSGPLLAVDDRAVYTNGSARCTIASLDPATGQPTRPPVRYSMSPAQDQDCDQAIDAHAARGTLVLHDLATVLGTS